jgi:predicted signal transduction protein with EAL and GGDEF domain
LALNVSGGQLRHPDFSAVVGDEIDRSGIRPGGLHLEVTRPDDVARDPTAVATLAAIRALGVAICLDGVGAPTSPLDTTALIRSDVLKIDRTVVDRLPGDPGAVDIVRSTIEHAVAHGMTTVAMGVASEEHRDELIALGCDRIQGFLIAPAVPVELADALLAADRSPTGGPAPEALITVVHAHRHLRSIDANYRPSSVEIAALAGVRPGQVRTALGPLGVSGARDSTIGGATDDQAISTMP